MRLESPINDRCVSTADLFSHPTFRPMPKDNENQNGASGANGATGGGNTDSPPVSPRTQKVWWFFTLNNWTDEEYTQMSQWLQGYCKKWVVGKEIGPNSGRPHLQGTFALNTKRRLTEVKKIIGPRYHLEACIDPAASLIYCAKDGDYISHGVMGWELTGTRVQHSVAAEIITDLRPWQKSILEILQSQPDCRTIHWIYEKIGGVGKTEFSKYCIYHLNTLYIQKAKYSDIMNAAFNTRNLNSFIIDTPRSSKNYVSYDALESVKSGIITNHKYEYGQNLIPWPHVLVFANYPPALEKLSKDRWKVYTIDTQQNLIELDINQLANESSDWQTLDPLEHI